jgi:heat shock protein HslJ
MTATVLSACGATEKGNPAAEKPAVAHPKVAPGKKATPTLAGGKYVAAHSNGTPVHLEFDAKKNLFYGRVVNRYNGSYTADTDGAIAFGAAASTMMAGLPLAMEAETEYFKFLPKVRKYDIAGNMLTLEADDGDSMRFDRE